MPLLAFLRSVFFEPDQLAKAKRELELGRSIVTGTRRGPRPALPYPDRIVDVSPVFRDALFDGLSRYVEEETSRRASNYVRRKSKRRTWHVPIIPMQTYYKHDLIVKPIGKTLSFEFDYLPHDVHNQFRDSLYSWHTDVPDRHDDFDHGCSDFHRYVDLDRPHDE